jgi:hypothetical protein
MPFQEGQMLIAHVRAGNQLFRSIALGGMGLMLSLAILCCGAGTQITEEKTALSLKAVETLCGLPRPCGMPMDCQDRPVTLWGYLDPVNIYSKQRYPALPYEKFRLVDRGQCAIEVWVMAEDSRPIFDRLARRTTDRIVVSGKLIAFDMPITGKCYQGIKVIIHDASQIEFK